MNVFPYGLVHSPPSPASRPSVSVGQASSDDVEDTGDSSAVSVALREVTGGDVIMAEEVCAAGEEPSSGVSAEVVMPLGDVELISVEEPPEVVNMPEGMELIVMLVISPMVLLDIIPIEELSPAG